MPNKVNVTVRSRDSLVVKPKKKNSVFINQSDLLATSKSLGGLFDVDITNKVDGSLLVYDESEDKFIASTLLEKQTLNGGHF